MINPGLKKSFLCIIILSLFPFSAFSAETYKFERMWPALQQPWYFSGPSGMATDSKGYIYIADMGNHCIKKFTPDGYFVTQFGTMGKVYQPNYITSDAENNIYVSNTRSCIIQKIDPEGNTTEWGGNSGDSEGEFDNPKGIAVDSEGNIYVADAQNHRIQRLEAGSTEFRVWGKWDWPEEYLASLYPVDIAVDKNGDVYVLDEYICRIFRFDKDGNPKAAIGSRGKNIGEFYLPTGIVSDAYGNIYVADSGNRRVQKFHIDNGNIIWDGIWESDSKGLNGISVFNGKIYVVDTSNQRVLKSSDDHKLIPEWGGTKGSNAKEFDNPVDITIDNSGNAYITDRENHRIQKISVDGEPVLFVLKENDEPRDTSVEGKFYQPSDIAIDTDDNLYIADTLNQRIQKLDINGKVLKIWGGEGTGEGYFLKPKSIAIDKTNNLLYVADIKNHLVQQFNLDGEFLDQKDIRESEDAYEEEQPAAVEVDADGNIYVATFSKDGSSVADSSNHRILKFSKEFALFENWGTKGELAGQFFRPSGIAIDKNSNIYVCDTENNRVQRWDNTDQEWSIYSVSGLSKSPDMGLYQDNILKLLENSGLAVNDTMKFYMDNFLTGEFSSPEGITIDKEGNIYISDIMNQIILKFDTDMKFISRWGGIGSDPGYFDKPAGIAKTSNAIYVLDTANHRIQKFDINGNLIGTIGKEGTGPGEFRYPMGIAVDSLENIYIADTGNQRIQKIPANDPENPVVTGGYISALEMILSYGNNNNFLFPVNIAVDEDDRIYVTDMLNRKIKILNSQVEFTGEIICHRNSDDSESFVPMGLAVHGGNIYVGDIENYHIYKYKYSNDPEFSVSVQPEIWQISERTDNRNFHTFPAGLFADDQYVYVADTGNCNILIFDHNGNIVSRFGETGSDLGQLSYPIAICADETRIYVADSLNHRVQIFKKGMDSTQEMKAIIIAGGNNDLKKNDIWNATIMSANFAYRALRYQGFSKENIYYLSADTEMDIDNNGVPDDVDGEATEEKIKQAITEWAKDSENLLIYFVDHGQAGAMVLKGGDIKADRMAGWLNEIQTTISGKIIFVYDACYSGSFLDPLKTSAEDMENKRIIITSASSTQLAWFISEGTISFSNYFWGNIFSGLDIHDAFILAKQGIEHRQCTQNSLLDANGDGMYTEDDLDIVRNVYIGNQVKQPSNAPEIGTVCVSLPDTVSEDCKNHVTIEGENASAIISAKDVTDDGDIVRVWAVIYPPDYIKNSSGEPVSDLPTKEMNFIEDTRSYQGIYDQFEAEGIYDIYIYARDNQGNTSSPAMLSVTVQNPLKRKAVIVIGGSLYIGDKIRSAADEAGKLAYDALITQGYLSDNIYLISPTAFSGPKSISTPSSDNLKHALTEWAVQDGRELLLYMVGNGSKDKFDIKAGEAISPQDLKGWLDSLQATIPGKVIVIYDACQSGSFLPQLVPADKTKERVVITSTSENEAAHLISETGISFSKYFWGRILNGSTLGTAFETARDAFKIDSLCVLQSPLIDINNDGNDDGDDSDAMKKIGYPVGSGIVKAAENITIESLTSKTYLNGNSSVMLWAKVSSIYPVEKVWAEIMTCEKNEFPTIPVTESSLIILSDSNGDGEYQAEYANFSSCDQYSVYIYARDIYGTTTYQLVQIYQQGSGRQFVLKAGTGNNGTISPSGNILVESGGTQIFQIIPNEGYMLYSLVVDGNTIRAEDMKHIQSYTFTDIMENHDLHPIFIARNSDNDNDGIPYWWEIEHNLNPDGSYDGDQDNDGDGFSNKVEYESNTNPNEKNSRPADEIKIYIGDVDGFGYGDGTGYVGADGGPTDKNGNGLLESGDVLPDPDKNQYTGPWSGYIGSFNIPGKYGDDFDNRSDMEKSGNNGEQWTDVSLSQSFVGSPGLAKNVSFTFRFDIDPTSLSYGKPHYVNFVYGDYDVIPMEAYVEGKYVELKGNQEGGIDGYIWRSYTPVPWEDMRDGEVRVEIFAPEEPYVTFDYALLSLKPIETYIPDAVFTAGTFKVCEEGGVQTEFLYDGGEYEGELGIFSLSGMENLEPGSAEFVIEAIHRVLSDSERGRIIVKDAKEGARFNGYLGSNKEEDHNKGPYIGIKTSEMTPGDTCAFILVPNRTFESLGKIASDTIETVRKEIIFSLATANPDDGMYYGQIAGILPKDMVIKDEFANALAFEDIKADKSDWDFNDIVIRIKCATLYSPTLDGLISGGYMPPENDWRTGQTFLEDHIAVPEPDPDTLWLTITLKSPADMLVYAPDGTSIGKDGGTIAGATLEWDKNGHQIVRLPALSDGDYRIVFRAIGEGGLCRLEVTGYQGDTQIATDEQSFVIEPHQVFSSRLSITEFMENRQIVFTLPATPFCSCGSLAYDFDADCDIDDEDISKASMRWGVCSDDSDYDAFYDLDENGCIEFYDIMTIANDWITCDE